MGKKINIVEVCPRDGWQNHKVMISTETKLKYIKKMIDYGAKKFDLVSFVNPKWVPQMKDAGEVMKQIIQYADETGKDIEFLALTLNGKGVENALAAGAKSINFVLSASEEHNMRNSNKPIEASLADFKAMAEKVKGVKMTLALACGLGSPFGDEVPAERIKYLCDEAFKVGVTNVGLADTAGISNPAHTKELIHTLKGMMDIDKLSLHLHDSHGMGLANAYAALEEGVTNFEASLAGMGGCPFVPGAKGNIATEDLVNMLQEMGYETGIDLDKALDTANAMCEEIQAQPASSLINARKCQTKQ
jgi:hydroxymethylglutaryl-CoA lyase